MIFFLRRTYCLILMRGQFFTIKATLSFIYTELKFQFWTKFYFLIIWNKHIRLSCRWGGGVLYNSQETKTDVAVLTSGCDLRPWPLLDIINTKVLSFPQSSRVDVIYSCRWKKNDTLKALKNFEQNFLHAYGLPNKFNIIEDEMNSIIQSTTFQRLYFFFNGH